MLRYFFKKNKRNQVSICKNFEKEFIKQGQEALFFSKKTEILFQKMEILENLLKEIRFNTSDLNMRATIIETRMEERKGRVEPREPFKLAHVRGKPGQKPKSKKPQETASQGNNL